MLFNPVPDVRIVANSIALSVLTGIAFGLLPALQASRLDLNLTLKETGAATGGIGRGWIRSALVTFQVAVCLVLLLVAGLLARGLQAARDVDPGFTMTNIAAARFDLNRQGYDAPRAVTFHRSLADRLSAQGMEVALVHPAPLSGSRNGMTIRPEGSDQGITISDATVSANYFRFLNIPMVLGRSFDDRDIASNAKVFVVSEAAAKRVWPGENPIGKHVLREGQPEAWEIIGVAKDIHSLGLTEPDGAFVYIPIADDTYRETEVMVRSTRGADFGVNAVRDVVRSLDTNVLVGTNALADNLEVWQFPSRVSALIGLALGLAGLLLAAMGIYGVVALAVSQRTREIGIRVSLGAMRRDVLRLILSQTLRPAAAGLAIGLAATAALSRILTSLLFGVSPLDPFVYGGVSLFLAAVAALASYIPARRAAAVDPMIALRHQ